MTEQKIAPYGSWESPLTSDLIVSEAVGLSQPLIDGANTYWIEMRPSERGRSVIVQRDESGAVRDINPPPFNARTRVHEYGGGDYTASAGKLWFCNFADQQIFGVGPAPRDAPVPITSPGAARYADLAYDRFRNRLLGVREDHSVEGQEAQNSIVSIRLDQPGDQEQVIAAGNDFYSSPRLSPDGSRLAWLTWNHPNMPWDGTELWCAEIAPDGAISDRHRIAGATDESIVQPEWSPDGQLYFVSDRTGWWNLYRLGSSGRDEPVCEMTAEFAMPQWVFGMSAYAFASPQRLVCSYVEQGRSNLALIELSDERGILKRIDSPYTDISYVRADARQAIFRASSPADPVSIVRLDLDTMQFEVLRRSMNIAVAPEFISIPQAIEFPTEQGLTAHGLYYPPKNRDYRAPAGERPPLLVKSHGGPTSAAGTGLALGLQYWTSRGVAVLDVNYGGSTGYGRPYRERLRGQWGIVDVDDCVNGARYLVERGDVDGERLMISGGSAGGYTTLCALTFRSTFKAGASHYGVSDVAALAKDTHKFESRYLDGMIGPYPQARSLYFERSPVNFTERLSCPVIFFQGLEDKVVPPSQAETMVDALRIKGLPVAYVAFPGEQHGFRQAQNIKRALDGELYFYSRVFGFELADPVEPLEIENLK
jgi:dipeptidyl aminopeptidase/acylaminoacyl peptidase